MQQQLPGANPAAVLTEASAVLLAERGISWKKNAMLLLINNNDPSTAATVSKLLALKEVLKDM